MKRAGDQRAFSSDSARDNEPVCQRLFVDDARASCIRGSIKSINAWPKEGMPEGAFCCKFI